MFLAMLGALYPSCFEVVHAVEVLPMVDTLCTLLLVIVNQVYILCTLDNIFSDLSSRYPGIVGSAVAMMLLGRR